MPSGGQQNELSMIGRYPDSSNLRLDMRAYLHPLFQTLKEGISEFTFANLYLFRNTHSYRVSLFEEETLFITGKNGTESFFMLPFALPQKDLLDELLRLYPCLKCVSESQARRLTEMGYAVSEDRDNFDYVYLTKDLAALYGRKYHKKKNLVNVFINNYSYEGRPLLEEYIDDALSILEKWKKARRDEGDYEAAREAIERTEQLQLCGGIYYVNGEPVAYTMGEEIAGGTMFLIHFEKAFGNYRGLYQFINMTFASILPEKYEFINREQDLGHEGLRQAKMSYRPHSFIKKYRVGKK